jgi:hypothetical protein
VIQNLHNYLLNHPEITSTFPFISMQKGSEIPILPFYTVPKFYYAQLITGLFFIFPFGIFGLVPPIILLRNLSKRNFPEDNEQSLLARVALILSGASLMAFSTLTVFFWAGIRYMGDFIPILTVLSTLGFWQGYQLAAHKPFTKRIYAFFGATLATTSILVSTLLMISTNAGLTKLIVRSFPFLK